MKVALSRNIIFRKNRFRIFFFKVKSLVSFCTVNYRGSPFFVKPPACPFVCASLISVRINFFFFNLFSCANRHTIRSPITDSLRPCTIYIDIRPIFPLETTQWNTTTSYTFRFLRSLHSEIWSFGKRSKDRTLDGVSISGNYFRLFSPRYWLWKSHKPVVSPRRGII